MMQCNDKNSQNIILILVIIFVIIGVWAIFASLSRALKPKAKTTIDTWVSVGCIILWIIIIFFLILAYQRGNYSAVVTFAIIYLIFIFVIAAISAALFFSAVQVEKFQVCENNL